MHHNSHNLQSSTFTPPPPPYYTSTSLHPNSSGDQAKAAFPRQNPLLNRGEIKIMVAPLLCRRTASGGGRTPAPIRRQAWCRRPPPNPSQRWRPWSLTPPYQSLSLRYYTITWSSHMIRSPDLIPCVACAAVLLA